MASDDATEDAFYIYMYIERDGERETERERDICLRSHGMSCLISDFSHKLYRSKVEENECFWLAESLCWTLFSINPLAGKELSSPTRLSV